MLFRLCIGPSGGYLLITLTLWVCLDCPRWDVYYYHCCLWEVLLFSASKWAPAALSHFRLDFTLFSYFQASRKKTINHCFHHKSAMTDLCLHLFLARNDSQQIYKQNFSWQQSEVTSTVMWVNSEKMFACICITHFRAWSSVVGHSIDTGRSPTLNTFYHQGCVNIQYQTNYKIIMFGL